jgi:hypothetical protein
VWWRRRREAFVVRLPKPRETLFGIGYACACGKSHPHGVHPHPESELRRILRAGDLK